MGPRDREGSPGGGRRPLLTNLSETVEEERAGPGPLLASGVGSLSVGTERIFIPGRPVPYPRSSINPRTGRRVTPRRYRDWLRSAAWTIQQSDLRRDLRGPVRAHITVHTDGVDVEIVELPNIGEEGRARPKHLRGDLDNYAKAVLDAAQFKIGGGSGWIDDDRQVVRLWASFEVDLYDPEGAL